jgi:hypothetical protein
MVVSVQLQRSNPETNKKNFDPIRASCCLQRLDSTLSERRNNALSPLVPSLGDRFGHVSLLCLTPSVFADRNGCLVYCPHKPSLTFRLWYRYRAPL